MTDAIQRQRAALRRIEQERTSIQQALEEAEEDKDEGKALLLRGKVAQLVAQEATARLKDIELNRDALEEKLAYAQIGPRVGEAMWLEDRLAQLRAEEAMIVVERNQHNTASENATNSRARAPADVPQPSSDTSTAGDAEKRDLADSSDPITAVKKEQPSPNDSITQFPCSDIGREGVGAVPAP